ncbi:hypothetical protein [Sphingomonas jatrophae]|uniref:Uncharacterized protein n=1 Tax=Sphingomonas jatrophae TaxID=1166337 RepID=A0A1I6M9J3_9SPHN|nr:hypothetical protein [Sphingomonas jatrophae]SFS12394.1 hypothetical protein SAMN05192580_3735 [Sphingomonas jatrophae]
MADTNAPANSRGQLDDVSCLLEQIEAVLLMVSDYIDHRNDQLGTAPSSALYGAMELANKAKRLVDDANEIVAAQRVREAA